MSFGAPSGCGIPIAQGDPDRLDRAWTVLRCTADGIDEHGTTMESTAVSLQPGWHGQAAAAYQELSSASSTACRQAAETLRAASDVVRRYSSELARCQREGMTATSQADGCLAEIEQQEVRLRDAQRAASDAQRSLDAARARARSPLGFPVAAVQGEVAAAQADLTRAQTEEAAATQAIERAQQELSYWQGHGRRAWEDSQTAAVHAGGGLAPLSIPPPPVAAPSASVAPSSAGAPTGTKVRKASHARGKARTRRGKTVSGGAPLPGAKTRHEPTVVRRASPRGGLLAFAAPLAGVAVTGPSRGVTGTRGGAGRRAGDPDGSATITIDPKSGTIETVIRTKSGETIETITYTKSGGTIETIIYPKSGPRSGSGVTIVNPGSGGGQGSKRPGGGSGKGSGATTVG